MTLFMFNTTVKFLTSQNLNVLGLRNLKSPVPFKWVKPEKIPCHKPEKSGDLKPLINIDVGEYPLEFRDSEELKTADDNVKRLFSLEYFPYNETRNVIKSAYLGKVQRHQFDTNSPEARSNTLKHIARMTANIRLMQINVEEFPKNIKLKVRLKETIDKRKKLLKFLRTWDYKCFEWLLEKLDLFYKPYPPYNLYKRIERRRSYRMLTDKFCQDIINAKLDEYRGKLESQQEEFLVNKIKNLKWIMKEELDCGLEPSITNGDIELAEAKLQQLRSRLKETDAKV